LGNTKLISSVAEVFTTGDALKEVASRWLARFQADGPEALTELVNLVLASCGCDLQVTVHDINDPDNADGKLADLQEEYQAVSVSPRKKLLG
jgi:cohesin complex subunit SA-1/2